jgi:hypothetical protein
MKFGYILRKGLFYFFNRPIIVNVKELERLRVVVPGWLEPGHIYCFDHAIKNLPDNSPILEIGTFAGLSTNVILYFINKRGKSNKLITTDYYWEDIKSDEKICTVEDPLTTKQYLKDSFIRNIKFFNPKANIFSSDLPSDDFFEAWKNKASIKNLHGGEFVPEGKISFAYIDGNHLYDFAKRDFENVDKLLVEGGFILFDDSADYTHWGSKTVAQEAVKSGRYKIVKKNPHYFVQKIK